VTAISRRLVVLTSGPSPGGLLPSLFLDEYQEKQKKYGTSHAYGDE
jgi:hypothetical protein